MPSRIGIHTIYPQITILLVRAAVERGTHWRMVKAVDNAGVAVDVKIFSPNTLTITRFVNEEWDAFQNGENWTATEGEQAAIESVQLIFDRTNAQERAAADWFEVVNEADPPGVIGWRAYGHWLKLLVAEADRRGVKLCLPAFNFGTPEWDEMVAFVETGLMGLMMAGKHVLAVHEGVDPFSDDPFDLGTIPGAPDVPGAGSKVYRYRYLYRLLEQRGEVVPLVISEFYTGGGYNWDKRDMIVGRMIEYDRQIRNDPYVLAVLPFTVDPDGNWQNQNYNPFYPAVLDYVVAEKDQSDVEWFEVDDISKHQSQYLGGNIWLPSNFNVDIDFQAAKDSGLEGFILRICYGDLKDPCFDRYVDALEAIDMAWGGYIYFLPKIDPHKQADLARQWCTRFPKMGVYGDFEDDPAPYFGEVLFQRHNNLLLRLDDNFDTVAGVYSRASYMDALFSLSNQRKWRHRRGWWAAPGAVKPNVAAGWMGLSPKYVMHQYTWSGMTPGLPQPHDKNRTEPGAPRSILYDATFDPKENYMAYLSHRTKDDALLDKLDAIQVEIDIDLQNSELGEYLPAGTVPVPPPAPGGGFPYEAMTKTGLILRDLAGNPMPGSIPLGVPVTVHMVLTTVGNAGNGGPYNNRAVIAPDGRNVWNANLDKIGAG